MKNPLKRKQQPPGQQQKPMGAITPYSVTNTTARRVIDGNKATMNQTVDLLATLIQDLKAKKLIP